MPPTKSYTINACDATARWTTNYDGVPLTLNTTGQTEGTGCLNLGISAANNSTYNWGEYNYKLLPVYDSSTYDYLQYKVYIADYATLTAVSTLAMNVITDDAWEDFYYWDVKQADLTTGWNTVNHYFSNPGDIFGSNNRGTLSALSFNVYYNNVDIALGNLRIDSIKLLKNIETQYDVKIDSQGYILKPGSYNQTDLPYALDRFSTGDLNYSDFNFWQYKAQTDWSGGGYEKFFSEATSNKFLDGDYIDCSHVGEIRMSPQMAHVSAAANTGAITAIESYKGSAFIGVSRNAGSCIYSWIGSGNVLTFQNSAATSSAIYDMNVYNDNLYVNYGSGPVEQYDGSTWSALAATGYFTQTLTDNMFVTSSGNLSSWDGTAWASEFTHHGWNIHKMKSWRNKLYYLASQNSLKYSLQTKTGLFSFDGIDRSELETFSEACKNSIELYNSKLWFVIGGILYSFNGELVNEELDLLDTYSRFSLDTYPIDNGLYDYGTGLKKVSNKLYVLNNNTSATTQILANVGNGFYPLIGAHTARYTCLGALEKGGGSENTLLAGDENGNLYYLNESAFSTTKTTYVESSWIDMDLFNVEKLFKSVAVYTESFPQGTNMQIYYKIDDDSSWTSLSGSNIAGEYYTENNFANGVVGKKIKYKITLTNSIGTSTPKINDVVIKYIIAPDTKRKWTMGIILCDEIIREDSTRELKTGKQLKDCILESRFKKKTVEFQDIDNSKYNVIINNVQIAGPFVEDKEEGQGISPEFHAFVELIEE